jgi:hypothetical protein
MVSVWDYDETCQDEQKADGRGYKKGGQGDAQAEADPSMFVALSEKDCAYYAECQRENIEYEQGVHVVGCGGFWDETKKASCWTLF